MSLETFLLSYGYLAIFAGILLEGDATLLAAGFLARRGYVALPWVLLIAALAALAKDHIIFNMGKRGRTSILLRKPKWRTRARKVRRALERHRLLMSLAFRFLPGVAVATPLSLGTGGMLHRRFILFDLAGVATWAVCVGLTGYAIGGVVERMKADIDSYAMWFIPALILAGLLVWLYRARASASPRGE